MGVLKINFILIMTSVYLSACARLIPSAPQAEQNPIPQNGTNNTDGNPNSPDGSSQLAALSGEFKQSDGSIVDLKKLNNEPLIIFFVGEFCATCREETNHLLNLFSKKGLPTKIKLISVLVGSTYEDIKTWSDSFEGQKIEWILGADNDELKLYKNYFSKLLTPSILYFDPTTSKTKKWQTKISIEQLEKETTPWY